MLKFYLKLNIFSTNKIFHLTIDDIIHAILKCAAIEISEIIYGVILNQKKILTKQNKYLK